MLLRGRTELEIETVAASLRSAMGHRVRCGRRSRHLPGTYEVSADLQVHVSEPGADGDGLLDVPGATL